MDQLQISSLSMFKLQICEILPRALQDYPYTYRSQILIPRLPPDVAKFLQSSWLNIWQLSHSYYVQNQFLDFHLLSFPVSLVDWLCYPLSQRKILEDFFEATYSFAGHSDVCPHWLYLQYRSILLLFLLGPFTNPPNKWIFFTIDHFFCFLLFPFNSVPQIQHCIRIETELGFQFKSPPLSTHLPSGYR